MLSLNPVCKIAILGLLSGSLLSCRGAAKDGSPKVEKSISRNSTNSPTKQVTESPASVINREPSKAKKPNLTSVKSFAFENPSPDWSVSESAKGNGVLTKATLKSIKSPVQMTVTSIGLPVSSKEAGALVRDCESNFAIGFSKHPELTREWIRSGFSISRYADPMTGDIFVWSVSETCKVQLKFAFGKSSNIQENIKIADGTTDDFFAKNPTGGVRVN